MPKHICIYQSNVFPPLHYFNRIMNSDVWVMLEDVQLNKKVGQTRLALKLQGQEHIITIPVLGGNRVKINEASIAYHEDWMSKLKTMLNHAYGKSPYFDTIQSLAIAYIDTHHKMNSSFQSFCEQFMVDMLRRLGWQGQIISSTGIASEFKASERMAEIAYQLEGTHYLCGDEGFRQYVDMHHFRQRKLGVIVQNWKCPEYPQSKGKFLRNLSILDLIANVDMNSASQLLVAGGLEDWDAYE